jgi:O-methyltransferase involved in polyketide biosynthesis
MQQGQASVTAIGAAGHRAAHQVLEHGLVFADPLALPILGPDADDAIARAREHPERRGLRLFIAMRSRFAEDSARRAIGNDLRQILVLGAGLDTSPIDSSRSPICGSSSSIIQRPKPRSDAG